MTQMAINGISTGPDTGKLWATREGFQIICQFPTICRKRIWVPALETSGTSAVKVDTHIGIVWSGMEKLQP